MNPNNLPILSALMLVACVARAEPQVNEVLRICDAAIAQGYDSLDAAMCDWYVRPCGICGTDEPAAWCIPETLSGATLAKQVTDWLRAAPSDAPAKTAVEKILREHFPCAAQDHPHS